MPFPQTLFTLLCLMTYFFAHRVQGRLYNILTQEDNFGEFVQFAILLCSIHLLWRARKYAGRLAVLLYLALLGLFFVAGEEISWGQRFFRWEWAWLQSMNTQNELNLHNILPLHGQILPYVIASLLLGVVAPLIYRSLTKYLRLSFGRLDTIDSLVACFLMLLCYLGLRMADHVYFYEFSEIWIYGLFLLQLRRLFRNLVEAPALGPYLFVAMACSLWMATPVSLSGF